MANLLTKGMMTTNGENITYTHISDSFISVSENQVQTPISANINIGSGQMFVTYNTMDKEVVVTLRADGADTPFFAIIPAETIGTIPFIGAPGMLPTGTKINYKIDTSTSSPNSYLVIASLCIDY